MFLLLDSSSNDTSSYLLAEKIVAGSACILSVIGALLVIFSFMYNFETKFSFREMYYKICCGFRVEEKLKNQEWATKYVLKSYNFILINLSIADALMALSHFWGLLSNLENKFAHNEFTDHGSADRNIMSSISNSASIYGQDVSCTTQAAITAMSTIASFFWTDILVVFLAFNIVFKRCTNRRLSNLSEDIVDGNSKIVVVDAETSCCDTPLFLYIIFPFIGWGIPMIMLLVFATQDMLGYSEYFDEGML